MKLNKGEEKNKLTNIFQIHCFLLDGFTLPHIYFAA